MLLLHKVYDTKDESEPAIDRIFDYMKRKNIDDQDLRIQRFFPQNKCVIRLSLGCGVEHQMVDINKLL